MSSRLPEASVCTDLSTSTRKQKELYQASTYDFGIIIPSVLQGIILFSETHFRDWSNSSFCLFWHTQSFQRNISSFSPSLFKIKCCICLKCYSIGVGYVGQWWKQFPANEDCELQAERKKTGFIWNRLDRGHTCDMESACPQQAQGWSSGYMNIPQLLKVSIVQQEDCTKNPDN